VSPTASPTHQPVFRVNLTLYNDGGEEVKQLASMVPAWQTADDFAVLTDTFAPKNGGTCLILAAGQTFTWDGSNDNGQLVINGVYYLKMQFLDEFGHVQVRTKEVTVVSDGKFYLVKVFNTAGELVRTLQVPASTAANAPSRVVPADKTLAVNNQTGAVQPLVVDLGSGTLNWDGRNDQGQSVASGNYTLQLLETSGNSARTLGAATVTVLNTSDGSATLSALAVVPNPVIADRAARLEIRFKAAPGTKVLGRIYNVAGELVVVLANDSDPGKMVLDFSEIKLASGVYVVAVWATAPWGEVDRQTTKFVIIR
jgi:flagellar hook assembly protein FlgD